MSNLSDANRGFFFPLKSRVAIGVLLALAPFAVLANVSPGLAQPRRGEREDGIRVRIESPADGLVVADGNITVSGSVSAGAGVLVNGVSASVSGRHFVARDVPLVEGTNAIVAVASRGIGKRAASDAISVRKDTDPPLVVIETPRDGDRLVSDMVTVAGTVNDIIPGATVNADDVSVTINGMPAVINNRSFLLADLPLMLGENTLIAVAVDRVGNTSSSNIMISREPDIAGIQIFITGGNPQSAPINSTLPIPYSVHLQLADGTSLPGRAVQFEVSRGDGLLSDPQDGLRTLAFLSDGNGDASVSFTLGSRTGEGFHRVRVTTPGTLTFAEFCATAVTEAPAIISMVRRPPMQAAVGERMTESLAVIVADDGGNPVSGVPVTFAVTLGGGSLEESGSDTVVIMTNQDGVAQTRFVLGPAPGISNHEVTATFDQNPGFPVTFAVSGLVLGAVQDTSVSGVVQNSAGQPIQGARAEIAGTNLRAFTGPDGKFLIRNVPPGGHRVRVLGETAGNPEAGVFYPNIDFARVVFSGVENPLDQIVILPFLDNENAKLVGGNSDVTLSMDGVSGFELTVFANSVILPDETRGEVLLSSSQVKFDKVPMPPPQGATPFVVGTIQPSGVRFDPPARITYPNATGLSPGDVADIFAFHHDIGQFVNVGPGTVSEDGAVITSDPGFGIVESGWHCTIRCPGPQGNCQKVNGCTATWSWSITANGTGSGSDDDVLMCAGDDPNQLPEANVSVAFNPAGTLSGSWSAQGTAIQLMGSLTGSTVAIKAVGPGIATLQSPTNTVAVQGGVRTLLAM